MRITKVLLSPPMALLFALLMIIGASCRESQARIPKPRAYPKVIFPARNYVQFDSASCPLRFTYPDYMKVEWRTEFFGQKPSNACWFDLDAQSLGAKIHWSYYPINEEMSLDRLVSDAFKIADQINTRANYMDEIRVANKHGVSGLLMEFSGAAASPLHFYLTDSTSHFLKASLYFQSKVVVDSLAPITDFLREDIAVIINSMTFE